MTDPTHVSPAVVTLTWFAWTVFAVGMAWVVWAIWNGSRRTARLALKSRAERENPMSAGCEMDAETLGLPVPARESGIWEGDH